MKHISCLATLCGHFPEKKFLNPEESSITIHPKGGEQMKVPLKYSQESEEY
jgi:hypothetical protein